MMVGLEAVADWGPVSDSSAFSRLCETGSVVWLVALQCLQSSAEPAASEGKQTRTPSAQAVSSITRTLLDSSLHGRTVNRVNGRGIRGERPCMFASLNLAVSV